MTQVTTISTPHQPQVIRDTKIINSSVEEPRKTLAQKKTIFRFYQIIWYILGILETLLIFRIVLKALGADPLSGFTAFIYGATDPLALPFQGILRSSLAGNNVIEWSTMIAGVVYFLIAYAIIKFFQFVKPVSEEEVEEGVDEV